MVFYIAFDNFMKIDSNTLLCQSGLESLKRVIVLFKDAPDPDVENAYLLEQYQANIGAALRPAFGADSLPQVSVLASQECFDLLYFLIKL